LAGAFVQGFSDGDAVGLDFQGHIGHASPTVAPYAFRGYKTNGSDDRTALAASEKVFSFFNSGTEIITFNGSGSIGLTGSFGTAGQVLTSQGSGTAPTWTTPSGGGWALTGTSTLTGDVIIDAGATNQITFQGSESNPILTITQTNTGSYGLFVNSANYGASFEGTENPLKLLNDNASTSTVKPVMDLERTCTGAGANGLGMSHRYWIKNSASSLIQAAEMIVSYSVATNGSEVSDFYVQLKSNGGGSPVNALKIGGTGEVYFHRLAGAGGMFAANTYHLAMDAGGKVLTRYKEGLFFAQYASVTVANTTTETTLLGTLSGTNSIDGATIGAGNVIRVKGSGVISTHSVATTLDIKIGVSNCTTTITLGDLPTSATNLPYTFEVDFIPRATGTSQNTTVRYTFYYEYTTGGATKPVVHSEVSTMTTTGTYGATITAQWGAANAANTLTAHFNSLEIYRY
jgi:hypothetical protein